jgi:uncharacterized protein YbcC (UPF0753/DUF2309 family)
MSAHNDIDSTWLHDLLHRLEQVLPAQAPIKDFVHHNTLHGFQHLHFRDALAAAEAATGNHGFQSPESFRAYFRQGRIDLADLNAALDETPELRADDILPGEIARRDVLLAALRFDLTPLPTTLLNWRIGEMAALERCQAEISSDAKKRLLASQDSEGACLAALWQACGDALAPALQPGNTEPPIHASAEAAELWRRHQIKQAAEHALSELLSQFGHTLSMRGLMLRLTGRDLMQDLRPYLIRHLAAHLDQGLAAWHNPQRPHGFYAAWLDSARHDPHFQFCDLPGWDQVLDRLPDSSLDCITQELHLMGVPDSRRADYLEQLAKELPGWSGMFLWRHEHPGYENQTTPVAMADYLAVRLVLERIHAQRFAAQHFKSEASLHGLRGYLHRHPAEFLVRLHLFAEQAANNVPEWLQEQGHRLVREATNHTAEEDDADWLPVASLLTGEADAAGRHPQQWPLFLLCQHLGLNAARLSTGGPDIGGTDMEQALLAAVAELTPARMGWVWLQAYERHYRQQILGALAANIGRGAWKTRPDRPTAQLVLCMDDREEGLRRHLEEIAPDLETLGAAAHFNVPHAWLGLDDQHAVALCPVVPSVVVPVHEVREQPRPGDAGEAVYARHVRRRNQRLAWKVRLHQGSRLGLLSPLLVSLAAAPATLALLAGKAFAPGAVGRLVQRLRTGFDLPVATRIEINAADDSPAGTPEARRLGFTDLEQADRVETLLRNIGLTDGFSLLVVIVGHASHSQNNPHGSAYNCGACAGRFSGPNARLVSAMANRPEVRALLRSRGIDIPEDTCFMGAEHDTCDDIVTWYDEVMLPTALRPALKKLQHEVTAACLLHAQERCRRFMSASLDLTPEAAWKHVTGRANDWSQARPELGHATNACAFFGRRSLSRGVFFDRRSFLISYDPSRDPDGEILERHLVINGAVGAGISLEYYFSSANNERYGCSTKVMHNVAGLLGVMEGAGSDLRTGLPRQMIEVHEAMRLLVVVEHTLDVLTAIYQRQPAVQELVKNAWVQLVAIDPDTSELHRFIVDVGWVKWQFEGPALPMVQRSAEWFRGEREALPPVLIRSTAEVS